MFVDNSVEKVLVTNILITNGGNKLLFSHVK